MIHNALSNTEIKHLTSLHLARKCNDCKNVLRLRNKLKCKLSHMIVFPYNIGCDKYE